MTPELLTEVVSFIASQFTTQALHSHFYQFMTGIYFLTRATVKELTGSFLS